jgi:hypothetical protein
MPKVDSGLHAPQIVCHGSFVGGILYEVDEDKIDGGFVATGLGHSINKRLDTIEKLREMVRGGVSCHFRDAAPGPQPRIARPYFVRDEALAA